MLNYFNFKRFGDDYLITNDFGRYAFLSDEDFEALVSGTIDPASDTGEELARNGFLCTGSDLAFVTTWKRHYAQAKEFAFLATSLNIIVVSTLCNMACKYCQANTEQGHEARLMTPEEARLVVDTAFSAPTKSLTFEFQGGEPLMNFEAIRTLVEHSEETKGEREVRYSLVSNLTLLNDDIIRFLQEHRFDVSTSIDGPQGLHDRNRPMCNGEGSFSATVKGIRALRNAGIDVGALTTVTRESLSQPEAIVDTYCELGFSSISLRPLTPLGCAYDRWAEIGYTPAEFSQFYKRALNHVLEKCHEGHFFQETQASLLLAKALHGKGINHMEFRSPCGAGLGQLAYFPGGDVFTCDEARMLHEMGDDSFRLGNVYTHSYAEIVSCPTCRATCVASILESAPGCCDCVYQPYCGVCPVVNIAQFRDLQAKEPRTYQCATRMMIFDEIFGILKDTDDDLLEILGSWNV